jgi:PAS domain-containing protein
MVGELERICPRCGERYADPDAVICGWDGTRLAPALSPRGGADDAAVVDVFGLMPSGVEISLVAPEEPERRARPRRTHALPPPAAPQRTPAAYATTGEVVAQALATDADPDATPEPPAPRGMPAVIAGRYQVEEAIGSGSFGSIFRVTHLQLGKPFALKRIHVDTIAQPRALEAFYREARLASSLDHPSIVSIVDFGEDPAIGAFMVMELLQGETLEERLGGPSAGSGRRLHIRQALDIILQTAEALHYIHERDIVHGDVKPANILLCRIPSAADRRRWQVKLLDFGIAHRDRATARSTDSIEGTPAYLAPERIQGAPPHPPVDIYALGCMAFEMITGRVPFEGTVFQVLKAQCEAQPPSPASLVDEPIDERVEALILRALAKDPAHRHKDMAAFIYELRTLMDMLGHRQRRRNPARARRTSLGKDRRALGERVGYQLCPVPTAGIDVDGTVVVANRAFARFLTGSSSTHLEGTCLYESVLADVYPQLAADVTRAHKEGAALQRSFDIWDADGKPLRLRAWLVPGVEDAGKVHVTIQHIDLPA